MPPVLRAENITKRYPGVLALDDARLEVEPQEVHGLVGENGAGKSTLVNVIAGVVKPDTGQVYLHGEPVTLRTPHEAHAAGIRVVFQHLSLVPQLRVVDNLFLGREKLNSGFLAQSAMRQRAAEVLQRLGSDIDPKAQVRALAASERYLVEIAKAIMDDPKLLILDEPTASFNPQETERLYKVVRDLAQAGTAIVWITHRLEELEQIADRATVMRDGKYVATLDTEDLNRETVIHHMTGRDVGDVFIAPPELKAKADTVLSVVNLSNPEGLENVNFDLKAGEVLGVGGLVGSGSSLLGRVLFGLEPLNGGEVRYQSERLGKTDLHPDKLIRRGIVYLPADRLEEGVIGTFSAVKNISLSSLDKVERAGFIQQRREYGEAKTFTTKLGLRPSDPRRRIIFYSGGNQQKAMLARGMFRNARLYIIDEPTQGIDVGAKREIYEVVGNLVKAGAAVLLISSDMNELLNCCHRLLVFHEGRAVLLEQNDLNEEQVLEHYFGASDTASDTRPKEKTVYASN